MAVKNGVSDYHWRLFHDDPVFNYIVHHIEDIILHEKYEASDLHAAIKIAEILVDEEIKKRTNS